MTRHRSLDIGARPAMAYDGSSYTTIAMEGGHEKNSPGPHRRHRHHERRPAGRAPMHHSTHNGAGGTPPDSGQDDEAHGRESAGQMRWHRGREARVTATASRRASSTICRYASGLIARLPSASAGPSPASSSGVHGTRGRVNARSRTCCAAESTAPASKAVARRSRSAASNWSNRSTRRPGISAALASTRRLNPSNPWYSTTSSGSSCRAADHPQRGQTTSQKPSHGGTTSISACSAHSGQACGRAMGKSAMSHLLRCRACFGIDSCRRLLGQLGPDVVPVVGAKVFAGDISTRQLLNARHMCNWNRPGASSHLRDKRCRNCKGRSHLRRPPPSGGNPKLKLFHGRIMTLWEMVMQYPKEHFNVAHWVGSWRHENS